MQLDEIRRDYKYTRLDENNISEKPIELFRKWMNDALSLKIQDATAMSLVTAGTDGFPHSRIVLLKDYDENGFTFFTNYNSDKGKSIAQNPKVSLHFYWSGLERQIRILGYAEKTTTEISRSYFESRPQSSQMAAIVSEQSSVIPSREFLQKRFRDLENKLQGNKLECPETWGGYRVKPVKFEFWQGRESRLHDRIIYEGNDKNWKISRLAP